MPPIPIPINVAIRMACLLYTSKEPSGKSANRLHAIFHPSAAFKMCIRDRLKKGLRKKHIGGGIWQNRGKPIISALPRFRKVMMCVEGGEAAGCLLYTSGAGDGEETQGLVKGIAGVKRHGTFPPKHGFFL